MSSALTLELRCFGGSVVSQLYSGQCSGGRTKLEDVDWESYARMQELNSQVEMLALDTRQQSEKEVRGCNSGQLYHLGAGGRRGSPEHVSLRDPLSAGCSSLCMSLLEHLPHTFEH